MNGRGAEDPGSANRVIGLLCFAVVLGGGGVGSALANLCVQLVALALLAGNLPAFVAFFRAAPKALAVLVTMTCALPLVQLIPLPPSMWTALPGRDLVRESLELAGGAGWFPATVNRSATLVAFLSLVAPLVVLVIGWSLPPKAVEQARRAMIGLGIGCAGLGFFQVLGGGILVPYPENPMPGVLFGTFGNRNSAGLFLVCCLLLLVSSPVWPRRRLALAMIFGAGLVLVLAVLLTQSRSSIGLLVLPAWLLAARLFAALRARWTRQGEGQRERTCTILLPGLLLAIATLGAATAILDSGRVQTSLSRFDDGDGARAGMRADAAVAARAFWPAGAGMGTFDDVFQAYESLENVSPRTAGRAHNDYLELAIEAGLPGLVLAGLWAAWLAFVVALTLARRRVGRQDFWSGLGAGGALVGIALQSIIDYPLRNQTMLCLAAFAILLVARSCWPAREAAP